MEREPATEFYLPIKQVEGMAHNWLCYNSGAAYYMAYLPYTRNRRILSGLCLILTNFWKIFFTPASRKDAALYGSVYMDEWPNATMLDSPYVDLCATWQAEHGIYNEYNLLGLTPELVDVLFAHGGDYPRYMDALREDAKEDAERLRGMDLFMLKSPAIEFANKINPRMLCHNIIAVGRLYYEDYMAVADDKMDDKLSFGKFCPKIFCKRLF